MNKKILFKEAIVLSVATILLLTSLAAAANTNHQIEDMNSAQPITTIGTFDTFTEGFEGGAIPDGWLNIDYDGDDYFWEILADAQGWPAHTGDYSAGSCSWDGSPLTPDNWLITPQLTLNAGAELTYWVAAQDPDWAMEHIEVWISTTGSDPSDFTDQVDDYTCPAGTDIWVERIIDLSAYEGEDIYIAFRHCECTDWFWIKIDDIEVTNVELPEDTTPPVTTCELDGVMEGDIFISDVTVTLNATDDMSGVDYTMYKLDDGDYQTYSDPFIVAEDGDHTLNYYSVDLAGNIEDEQTCTFTIAHPCFLEVEVKGGFGVTATASNSGEEDLTNLEWNIALEGGFILVGGNSGVIDVPAGESVDVKSGLCLGFGQPTITVTVDCITIEKTGLLLLFFVLGI